MTWLPQLGLLILFALPIAASTPTIEVARNARFSDLASARNRVAIVWLDIESNEAKLLSIDSGGAPGLPEVLASNSMFAPHVAAEGNRFFVVWRTSSGELAGTMTDESGAAGPSFTIANLTSLALEHGYPQLHDVVAIAWSGTRYLITLSDDAQGTVGLWVTTAGLPGDSFRVGSQAVFAPHEDTVGVAWTEHSATRADAFFSEYRDGVMSAAATVDTQGAIYGSPFILAHALAWNGSEYYFFFSELQYPRYVTVRGERIDEYGHVSAQTRVEGDVAYFEPPVSARVLPSGGQFIITWVSGFLGFHPLRVAFPSGAQNTTLSFGSEVADAGTVVMQNGEIAFAYVDHSLVLHAGRVGSAFRRAVRR